MRSKYNGNLTLRLYWLVACLAVGSMSASAADRPSTRIAQAASPSSDANMSLMLRGTSDKDKLKFASDATEEMAEGMASLQKRIEEARQKKNIMLLNCLNEKYSSVSALHKVTETASILMQEALSQNNSQQADHQFRRIVIARFKAKQLLQEANECTGDDDTQATGEEVTVTVDSALEGDGVIIDEPVDPVDVVTNPPDLTESSQ